MPPPNPISFEPSEPYQGLARIVVFLGTNYVGTIAQRQDGAYEFVPHRSGAFRAALRLLPGPHVATSETGIRHLVSGLLAGMTPPASIPWYVAVRSDGKAWNRPFTSEAAAWRALVKGTNTQAEWRQRKADLEQAGWKVQPAQLPAREANSDAF